MHPQIITQASYDYLKKEAKRIRKINPKLKQREALDEVAVKLQFKDWFHLKSYAKKLESKLLYTLERGSFFQGQNERLQLDGSWRKTEGEEGLRLCDFSTASISEAKTTFIKYDSDNPAMMTGGSLSNFMEHTSYSYKLFRNNLPKRPSLENLTEVIANGDDSKLNTLILNCFGKFELREWHGSGALTSDPTIVCRHETNPSNGNYVGQSAALDKNYLLRDFKASLDYWLMYMETGRVGFFADLPSKKKLETLNLEIDKKEKKWISEFQLLALEE